MRQPIAGFLTLTALLGLTAPLQAQEMVAPPVTPSCTAALANAQQRLESGRQLKVSVHRSDLATSYADHPPKRPFEYTFAFQGPAELAIINSPTFMTALATDVIQACSTVSMVTFAVKNSDNLVFLGLMPNGQVKAFDCLEATRGSNVPLVWGKRFCV